MKVLKGVLKALLILVGAVLVFAICFVLYLTITEYNPDPEEILTVSVSDISNSNTLSAGDSLSVLTFNIGYGGLSETEDFFMDGGEGVRPDNKALVEENLTGITGIIDDADADIVLIQEIDQNSKRGYGINEFSQIVTDTGYYNSAFANNYKCNYVPFPWPTIGKVDSGVSILNSFEVSQAKRISLPVPFSWPVRAANLKRCMLVERLPIEGSESELVLINVHLEAYDDGEGKAAQTRQLLEYIYAEYAKDNYVLVGGDFNHLFPDRPFELLEDWFWCPPSLEDVALEEGWSLHTGDNAPTSRLNNRPYLNDPNPQLYYIDGFLLSPNLLVKSVKTVDAGFKYSDHNPVYIELILGEPIMLF